MTTRRIGTVLALGALTMSAGTFQIAAADETHNFSANIGVVSNYMFRGLTQTDDGPAVQGGLD
ncbi:TorF family putative porin, partial [Thiocapsa sp.]|uniref:TorF family putative porin n=1 Tax=Thiocapsa sp. TaxID=2024551 RepID=UPI002D7E5C62